MLKAEHVYNYKMIAIYLAKSTERLKKKRDPRNIFSKSCANSYLGSKDRPRQLIISGIKTKVPVNRPLT